MGRKFSPVVARPARAAIPPSPNIPFALKLWTEGGDPRRTIVQHYLATRPERLPLPDDLAIDVIRYHPSLLLKQRGIRTGAMLALFRDIITDDPCGIHRTFLDNGGGKLERRMLGRAENAAIKLDADDSVCFGIVVGEGLETCMSARLAGFRPVWCLGSAVGIQNFPVLTAVDAVTVLMENDAKGVNANATEQCRKRWHKAGREVLIVEPLVGKDFADTWAEVQR